MRNLFKMTAKDLLKRAAVFAAQAADFVLLAPRFWKHIGQTAYREYMTREDDLLWSAPTGPFSKTRRRIGALFEASSASVNEVWAPATLASTVGVIGGFAISWAGASPAGVLAFGTGAATAIGVPLGNCWVMLNGIRYADHGITSINGAPELPDFLLTPLADRTRCKLGLD